MSHGGGSAERETLGKLYSRHKRARAEQSTGQSWVCKLRGFVTFFRHPSGRPCEHMSRLPNCGGAIPRCVQSVGKIDHEAVTGAVQ
jgi:hypothetical protein